jgi:hypothetical protein
MAYELSNPVHRVGPQNSNGPTIWTYADGDALATIDGSGYFNLAADKLQVGDIIFAYGNGVLGVAVVASNTRDMTASPPVEGVVDTSNFVSLSAIDSD